MNAAPPIKPAYTCAGCGAFAFLLYLLTAARAPQFGDGLELVASAAILGVPHPTGYPLLMLLLAPFAHGPHAYFLCTLVCALFAAVAAASVCALARELMPISEDHQRLPLLQNWWPPFMGVLAAFSASLWSSATHVEAYSLNAFFLALNLFLLLRRLNEPLSAKALALAAFCLGLGAANHVTSLCLGPLFLARLFQSTKARKTHAAPTLAISILTGTAGLLPYLYLPIRAAAKPAINWGNAQTWRGFAWMISGGDYKDSHFLMLNPAVRMDFQTWTAFATQRLYLLIKGLGGELLGTSVPWLSVLLGLALAATAVIGVRRFWERQKLLTFALLIANGLQLFFILTYNIADIGDYFLALWITMLPFALIGSLSLLLRAAERFGYLADVRKASRLKLLFVLLPLIALGSNWGTADRSRLNLAAAYMERLFNIPQDSLLLATHDYDAYAAWYYQHALGKRGDVLIVSIQFLRLQWYHEMIPVAEPDARGRQIVTPRTGSFRDFDLYRYADMVMTSAIEPNVSKVPVVITSGDPQMLTVLERRYKLEFHAPLLTEEELEWMAATYPAAAPALLYRIEK